MIKKLHVLLFIFFVVATTVTAQTISGTVRDARTHEFLPLANIIGPYKTGTVTDLEGKFSLSLPSGVYQLQISFVGYEAKTVEISLKNGVSKTIEILLSPINQELETVVISAGKYEQRAEETTVSIEVIKPNLIVEKNTVALQDAFNQTPGVNVTDNQINIRSGSGWSFGAGSRVLMMVDDMPMLSPDAGQIQWKLLPTEAVYQMEVIKGASSALFGTSAMNGLINVRTVAPKEEPTTEVILFGGFYDTPKRKELKWWDGTQSYGGFSFLHSHKIKNAELTVSGLFSRDPGFRYQVNDNRNRLYAKLQFHPQKIKGLSWGIAGSLLYAESGDALLWESDTEGYIARDSSATHSHGWDFYIDPTISYQRGRGKHMLRGRFMTINNDARTDEVNYENHSTYYYSEYQYQHFLAPNFWVTTGLVGALGYSQSEVFAGYHETQNGAAFLQADKKFKRLSLSAGFRYEAYKLDERTFSKPVFRAGANYRLGRGTFLRASYGGGYRFPSMAEVYTNTRVGAAGVYPNQNLTPESGWSAEIGINQGVKISDSWKGFIDVAGFINHFDNMSEFSFGFWGNSSNAFENIGFRSVNVGPTEITGIEFTLTSMGKIGPVETRILAGYAYMNPVALEPNRVNGTYTDLGGNPKDITYVNTSSDPTNNILKYRYQHLAKADILLSYRGIGLGFSTKYNDFMQNIDAVFVDEIVGNLIAPGVQTARNELHSGDLIFDARVYYEFSKQWRLSFIVDNLTNREVMPRPAQLGPPRKFTFQVKYSL